MAHRIWAVVLAGVLTGGLLAALPPQATIARAATAAPVATPASPTKGERFTLTGKVSTKIVRKVVLQLLGANDDGQLGDGTTTNRSSPVRIADPG